MNHNERMRVALEHRASVPVAVDFGSTSVTGMHVSCVAALREHYGLERRLVRVIEPYQMLGGLDEDLLDVLGVDAIGLTPRNTMFGFPNENWRPMRLPWGQEALVPEHFQTTVGPGGDWLIHPGGDLNAPPSGRLPKGGFFFDSIIRQPPIVEEKLNPEDNMEEFTPISNADLEYFRSEAARLAKTGRAVVATFGGTGFGDIALVPAPFLKSPKGIRDVAEWYMSTALRQDYIHAVFARQCEIALANLEKIHKAVGDGLSAVFICGTDFGTQTSTFCSPGTFDSLYAPYYRRINDWVHAHTPWKTFKHSCGAVEPFLGRFADVGFDIINPVQCSARGMDARLIKKRYGRRLVFWGGGVDTQRVLPFGTPDEVRAQVLERCRIFSRGGGFVFNTIHNVQANTPVRNIVAMFDAVKEFNGEK
jgi:hypothetical protein